MKPFIIERAARRGAGRPVRHQADSVAEGAKEGEAELKAELETAHTAPR
jgi:hypothetical protein